MRPASEPTPGRGRALWTLAVVAALEAVVIAALLVAREPSPADDRNERVESARTAAAQRTPDLPAQAFEAVPAPRPGEREPSLPPASTAAPETLVAPASTSGAVGIVICGSVAAADGGPIDDELVVVGFSDRDAEVVPVRGAWSAAGFAPGSVRVSCTAVDFMTQTLDLDLDATRPVERHDFRLEAAPSIPVAFRTPDGQPLLPQLEDALVPGRLRAAATLQAPGAEWTEATPQLGAWLQFGPEPRPDDPNLHFAEQGWTGLIKPYRQPPFFVSAIWGKRVLASQLVTSADVQVVFTFALDTFFSELGSVRARVVDRADHRPAAGFLAALDSALLDVQEDGTLLFERVAPGKHTLKLFPSGSWQRFEGGTTVMHAPGTGDYEQRELPIECRPGEQLDLGDLDVQRTVVVRGRVTNSAGAPIVTSVSVTEADAPAGVALRPSVDEHGGFVVRVVPGRWTFSAGPETGASPRTVQVADDIEDLILVGVGAPVGR